MKTLKTNYFILLIAGLTPLLLLVSSCGDNSTGPDTDGETEIINKVDVDLPVHAGEVGLVIDTREIFRKGFIATEAGVTFPGHSGFNETLAIDPVTNLAILRIPNEDLTDEQKAAFADGIVIDIVIYDDGQTVLAEYHNDERVLDDSGDPLRLQTNLVYTPPPLMIKKDVLYLLQPEGQEGVVQATCSSCFVVTSFTDHERQEFKFTPVDGKPDTYLIEGHQFPDPDNDGTGTFFRIGKPTLDAHKDDPWIFLMKKQYAQEWVLEQDDDGWARIRRANSSNYFLAASGSKLREAHKDDVNPGRFRLISNDINWSMVDMGTVYHQPIMPSAKIEFAYEATIRNCSSGTLTEQVGTTKSRTSTHIARFSESLQVFSSHEFGVGIDVKAALGGEIYGAKTEVNVSANYSYTRSNTSTTETGQEFEGGETTSVSRTRSLEIPPFTGIEVYDAVRVVSGARVPYTQRFRLSATYEGKQEPLTGDEIMTQLMFNFVTGVPSKIGDDYVDISLRGQVDITEMFSTESGANELSGACD